MTNKVFLFAATLALAASASAGVPKPAALVGTTWKIVKIDGQPPASPRAELRFLTDRISATAGCNGMGGAWQIRQGKLTGGPFASTMMYCEGLMEQERALGAVLSGKSSIDLKGQRLTLRALGHSAELVKAG